MENNSSAIKNNSSVTSPSERPVSCVHTTEATIISETSSLVEEGSVEPGNRYFSSRVLSITFIHQTWNIEYIHRNFQTNNLSILWPFIICINQLKNVFISRWGKVFIIFQHFLIIICIFQLQCHHKH